jgi:hypothetical protein
VFAEPSFVFVGLCVDSERSVSSGRFGDHGETDLRSETPPGFARAVFEANAGRVLPKTGVMLSSRSRGECSGNIGGAA